MRKMIFISMCISTLVTFGTAATLYAVFFYYGTIGLVSGVFLMSLASLVNYFLTSRLTSNITSSISKINFSAPDEIDTYDELSSFVDTILRQQEQIESHVSELKEQSETTGSIFENMSEGFVMLDRFGVIVSANRRAREIFSTDEGCIGNNVNYLSRNSIFTDKVRAALQGHSGQMILDELEQIHQITFIHSKDRGAIILVEDVTERQLAEKMRREFSANVSHELNTPLTAIAGFSEILQTGTVEPEDVKHFATNINNEARRMIAMVENILFLSKLDEMDGRDTFEQFDAATVARETVENLRPAAEAAQLELSLAATESLMYGNRHLIQVLLTNLITNAIHYNKPRGWVKVAVSLRNRSVYINVSDTGVGIPKEEQSRVFERFYRVEQGRGGAGLGLSIVKHIVRYHGGTIDLESQPDEGTRMFVKLPQDIFEEA